MPVVPFRKSAFTPQEERQLRDLGMTVAVLWHRLPVEMKALILNQTETGMRSEEARTRLQELHAFLGNYTPPCPDTGSKCTSTA